MSQKYPGGFITKSPVAPTSSAASGIWTLDQQVQAQKAGNWPAPPNYIEDVFSTYLYTGTGAALTITNNIDLSTKGGLTWIKGRSGATGHRLTDTARGVTKSLESNSTAAEATESTGLTAFGTTGFTIGADADYNTSAATYASWTFREQPKFFDVVTWTGDDASTRSIPHNLGSTPGCVFYKRTNVSNNWIVWHRSTSNFAGILNTTDGFIYGPFASTPVTSTTIEVGSAVGFGLNTSGTTYVAYLFAHDAGGFGLTGTDNVISCGSFTADGSGNATVSLGYEPQWVMMKRSDSTGNWFMLDVMRQMSVTDSALLRSNLSNEEALNGNALVTPTATGFNIVASVSASSTHIYIAIRRGPMKVPTTGTSVFSPVAYTGNGTAGRSITAGFPVDLAIGLQRTPANGSDRFFVNRLVGATKGLVSWDTFAEATDANSLTSFASMTDVTVGTDTTDRGFNGSGRSLSPYFFRRAPSFMDVVCYTGTGTTLNPSHNLGVIPELKIIKCRSSAVFWVAGGSIVTGGTQNNYIVPNTNAATVTNSGYWSSGSDTSTTFSTRTGNGASNDTGQTFVAYLFATCAGVSKVGSYTGTATTKQIDCGFTAGARFVLIKRTDSTGDWYVWDTARGIVSGNDPYLLLNSTAAEVTNTDYIDTYSAGFEISSTAPAAINASGGTFIFLAIA